MRILITNDDGIASPALPRLAAWAKQFGEVTVIAPKVEQSGKSHAIDFFRPIEIKEVCLVEGVKAYSVDSTPADCVRYGVLGMKMPFDLILSGPNRGYNLGRDLVYSGTVGAIFEGARLGIPAVALSTTPDSFEPFFERLDSLKDFFLTHGLLARHTLYNVNVPENDRGIRITRQGGIYFTDEFVRGEGDLYLQEGHMVDSKHEPLCYDTAAICNGYLSITPLTAEKTYLPLFEELQNL